jgi:hypothetical protein
MSAVGNALPRVPSRLEIYFSSCRVLLKDFSSFAQQLTDRIKQGAYELFRKAGRPVQYLSNSETSKEALAQQLAKNSSFCPNSKGRLSCRLPIQGRLFHLRAGRKCKKGRILAKEIAPHSYAKS